MGELSWLQFIANAGGPTIVAVFAMWIIHKRDGQTVELMKQFQALTERMLTCQTENTKALTSLEGTTRQSQEVMTEVHDLLKLVNGGLRDTVAGKRRRKE